MDMGQVLNTFLSESRELLEDMEQALLKLEQGPDEEAVNQIFRAAHTIKGSAGLFGLDHVVEFTHSVETVLDRVRSGALPVDEHLAALLLDCCDHMRELIDAVDGKQTLSGADGIALQARLAAYFIPQAALTTSPEMSPKNETSARVDATEVQTDNWHVSLRFGREMFRNGMDPLSFIQYLGGIGQITFVTTVEDAMPDWAEMDAESCYLGFEISFRSEASKCEIENVFEFVRDDCEIHILPPRSRIDEYLRVIEALPEEDMHIGQILVACGTLTAAELDRALSRQASAAKEQVETPAIDDQHLPLGQILLEERLVAPNVVSAALKKQTQAREHVAVESNTLRIQSSKLDELINLVGELVIAGASTSALAQGGNKAALSEATETMSTLIEEVRNHALQLRMVEIGVVFNRFQRVVRDVSKELGKVISLEISGADTELDKSVIEKIADPLTHLVRNAIDHGIEAEDLRRQRGKPPTGTVSINAFHDSGAIVIEVSDDGGGLNRNKIYHKAIERGLVQAEQTLAEHDVFKLIFEPGFSTAETVSNLSGRGVGMDVVRRNIEALRGTITIESEEGIGTTIRVRLPLTLAIIDGFLMGVGDASYVVPLDNVLECLEIVEDDDAATDRKNYINLRGRVLPLMRLGEYFGHARPLAGRQNVVVVRAGEQMAGLVVDRLMGELQTVIKPLGTLFGSLSGVSGSTILGSGLVALILDVNSLLHIASAYELGPTNTQTVENAVERNADA